MGRLTRHIVHGSRLIYIYLTTLLVSGGIMVYLSINSISNFRELTEKRILETEKAIHEDYTQAFQAELDELTTELQEFIYRDSSLTEPAGRSFENKLVPDYMLMLENGALIRPHFSVQKYNPSPKNIPKSYWDAYRKGEDTEFKGYDLNSSESLYQRALKLARTSTDSARVYNALSRLQIKLDRPDKAFDYYQLIVEKHGDCKNDFGIPFSYFSLDQALKLDQAVSNTKRRHLLNTFISGLNEGNIPFTQQTERLLYSLEHPILAQEDSLSRSVALNKLLTARSKDFLARNYTQILLQALNDSKAGSLPVLNGFDVLISENVKDTVLLSRSSGDLFYGFPLALKSFDRHVRDSLVMDNQRFEYETELLEETPAVGDIKPYSFIAGFSPYFPNHEFQVKLRNESAVNDYVLQRSVITIIGLILLLAAMIIGFIMLVRDVVRQREIEKLRSDFIANVTHELKTPLTSITMFADSILMDRYRSEKGLKKYTRIILKESEKLKRMVNNILEFSRQENKRLAFTSREENLSEIIYKIMEEMDYWLMINNFTVSLDLEDPLYALADSEGLKQVLSNLITNAIKYSLVEKKIVIRSFSSVTNACIEVEDHGIGIPEDEQESIFRKFYRVRDNQHSQAGGTGLGLTVSKDIVEAMNGTLTVKSKIGQGSTFRITLIRVKNK